MVVIDGSDDGEFRRDDVGGIEAAAESDFDHGGRDGALAEEDEGHGCDGLEIGGVEIDGTRREEFFGDAVDCVEGSREFGGTDRRPSMQIRSVGSIKCGEV